MKETKAALALCILAHPVFNLSTSNIHAEPKLRAQPFSTLTLLVDRQGGYLACSKNPTI